MKSKQNIKLPEPVHKGNVSVEEAVFRRRSVRNFSDKPLSMYQLSQLVWAAQGITEPGFGLRAIPSAGATYPLEIFVSIKTSGVTGVQAGLYQYQVSDHSLLDLRSEDITPALASAALGQTSIKQAQFALIVCAVRNRIAGRYGKRSIRYVAMEAGHVGQNVHLQAVALGVSTVMIGAFDDEKVAAVLGLDESIEPLYIMPVGYEER